MNNNNANTFERSRKKSLSTKKEVDFFNYLILFLI